MRDVHCNECLAKTADCVADAVVKGSMLKKVSSGIGELDDLLGGGIFLGPTLTLVSGVPGSGKSGLLFDIAIKVASEGTRVLLYSLESSADTAIARLVRTVTGIDAYRNLDPEGRIGFADSVPGIKELPIDLHAADLTSISMINEDVEIALDVPNENIVVVIDGGDYIFHDGELTSSLKSIAIEWSVPIVCSVASKDVSHFLRTSLLADEALFMQKDGNGYLTVQLVKSRTCDCGSIAPVRARFNKERLKVEFLNSRSEV